MVIAMTRLVFLLGQECGGVYSVARSLRRLGFNVGLPLPKLAKPYAARHQPDHAQLWIWQALRRYFDDLGLPPIAEPPPDIISVEQRRYYIKNFARCLEQSLSGGPFFYADHLAALALPLFFKAAENIGIDWKAFFFFSNPADEISYLKIENGAPPKLSEFIWRNSASAAAVHKQISFVDVDSIDMEKWKSLLGELTGKRVDCAMPPIREIESESERIELSPLTSNLHAEMVKCAASGNRQRGALERSAREAAGAQAEQNGWQYFDYLDCLDLSERSKRILAHADACRDGSFDVASPEERDTFDPQSLEWEMLLQRQDFAAQLFLHNQSLRRHYLNCLEDERLRHEHEISALKHKYACLNARRKKRMRVIFNRLRLQ